jgi:hypothetical protein
MPERKRAANSAKANQDFLRGSNWKRHLDQSKENAYRPPAPAPGAIAPEDGVVPTLGPGEPARGPDPREELLAPIEGADGTDAPASGDVLPSEFVPYPVPENGAPEDWPGPAPPPTPGGLAPGV